jgi:hypothetical protein
MKILASGGNYMGLIYLNVLLPAEQCFIPISRHVFEAMQTCRTEIRMKPISATSLNPIAPNKYLRNPRDLLHASLCISGSAFISLGLIVWMLS